MEKGYFAAAWGDITKSPGWASKFLRLALLCCVPIFGPVVVYGYLFGWARDIAWNVHRPLPDRVFGNEDGNLYKRGFFIFIVAVVFALIPGLFSSITSSILGTATYGIYGYAHYAAVGTSLLSVFFSLVALVLWFLAVLFSWVGSMRTSLYGTLSSGFQLGKIWAMIRYDFMGLLRIFGMSVLCMLVVGLVCGLVFTILVIFGVVVVTMAGENAVVGVLILAVVLVAIALLLVTLFLGTFIEALITRALGYWTRQFEVAQWGGQEDPMPFEQRFAAERTAQAQTFAGGAPQQNHSQSAQSPIQDQQQTTSAPETAQQASGQVDSPVSTDQPERQASEKDNNAPSA